MIIGTGDIAKVLTDTEGVTLFASGVSDSACNDTVEFAREYTLLLQQPRTNKLVYFSSLSIYCKESPYTRHKIVMERIVKDYFPNYCIIRLGNITWGNNPNTIINFLKKKIKNNEPFEIRDEYKYICSLEEFNYWVSKIPAFNTEMNITGERIKVSEIVKNIKSYE